MIVERPEHLIRDWGETTADVGGTGSASTCPMSDEEKAAAKKRESRKAPLGFTSSPPPKRKRNR